MILAIAAPFLTSVAFDRKWMAYDVEKVDAHFNNAKNNLTDKNIELGLFLLPCSRDLIFYGDIDEPGELFRDFFIARKLFDFDLDKFIAKEHVFYGKIKLIKKPMVSWLDNGFGYFETLVVIDDDVIVDFSLRQTQSEFDRLLNDFFNGIFNSLKSEISNVNGNLLQLQHIIFNNTLPSNDHRISGSLYWVHKIWFVCDHEFDLLSKVVSNKTLARYKDTSESVWGWGDSILKVNKLDIDNLDLHWRQGMLLAQYYHTVLNDILRLLPFQIEKMKLLIDQGLIKKAHLQTEEIIYKINSILIDFEIAKNLTAGRVRSIFDSLIDRWETTNIASGIATLNPYLREIVKQAGETLKSWSQTSIETILFLSATIGFFGLSIAVHDYLIPSKERYDFYKMSSINISSTDPLVISGMIFAFSVLVFYFSKTGFILRFYRVALAWIKKISNYMH
jgi:hypothetical protein